MRTAWNAFWVGLGASAVLIGQAVLTHPPAPAATPATPAPLVEPMDPSPAAAPVLPAAAPIRPSTPPAAKKDDVREKDPVLSRLCVPTTTTECS